MNGCLKLGVEERFQVNIDIERLPNKLLPRTVSAFAEYDVVDIVVECFVEHGFLIEKGITDQIGRRECSEFGFDRCPKIASSDVFALLESVNVEYQ
jgi:hypothetical protein